MFRVEWVSETIEELATIYLQADPSTRRKITSSAEDLDKVLQSAPDRLGESRTGSERIAFIEPLGFRFVVDQDRRIVQVRHVWKFRRRRQR